jgi:6-phosphofructokinase 1
MKILELGPRKYDSPLDWAVDEEQMVPSGVLRAAHGPTADGELFEQAGPRKRVFFPLPKTRAAIVTCGGLCPGLNNVIRSAFLELHHHYGVPTVLGIRYGYQGLNPANGFEPVELTPRIVSDIHRQGGTLLGTSRGRVDPDVMVDFLVKRGIQILLCVGGDGGLRGAHAIAQAAIRKGYSLAVVGVPKTIDNDVPYVTVTFGYQTAVEEARNVLDSAHNEARAQVNGVGLVKLMGREAGFIAAGATLASQEVNFTLIPEAPFRMDKFLMALQERLLDRGHAVIAVAEGAGQELLRDPDAQVGRDASGNRKLADIGPYLQDRIVSHFAGRMSINLKYIDPSYIIRSRPANTPDALLCDLYARNAVHAAVAGKTDVMIGLQHDLFIHVPLDRVASERRRVQVGGLEWKSVLSATGQPDLA